MTGLDVESCVPSLALALPGGTAIDPSDLHGFLEAQRQRGLVHGTRPLCNVLSPLTLSGALYRRVTRAAALVARAMERVVAQALADPAFAARLGLSARERALAALDPGRSSAVVVGRLDMVFTEGSEKGEPTFSFLELNADSPAGIADQMLLEQTLFRLPVVREHCGKLRTVRADAAEGLVDALLESFRRWGGEGMPRVAIVDWRQVDTATEQEVLRRLLEERGMPAVLADPDDLRFEGGRLVAAGAPVDLVYRRVVVRELLASAGDDHPLLRAHREGAVCLVNPLRSTIANKKAAFAVLSDPAWAHLFASDEREVLHRHIPWSRVLGRGGNTVPRADLLRRHHELVLKPNDDYGGKGVTLGWTAGRADWLAAVERALAEGGVVQQRVHPRRLRFPTLSRRGAVSWQELGFDCDPFLFLGRAQGAMVRVSRSPLSNVAAGGGVTGLLVLDDGGTPSSGGTPIRHV
jgi:Glutathionylspermidine synthase preATP-grasp